MKENGEKEHQTIMTVSPWSKRDWRKFGWKLDSCTVLTESWQGWWSPQAEVTREGTVCLWITHGKDGLCPPSGAIQQAAAEGRGQLCPAQWENWEEVFHDLRTLKKSQHDYYGLNHWGTWIIAEKETCLWRIHSSRQIWWHRSAVPALWMLRRRTASLSPAWAP